MCSPPDILQGLPARSRVLGPGRARGRRGLAPPWRAWGGGLGQCTRRAHKLTLHSLFQYLGADWVPHSRAAALGLAAGLPCPASNLIRRQAAQPTHDEKAPSPQVAGACRQPCPALCGLLGWGTQKQALSLGHAALRGQRHFSGDAASLLPDIP